MGARGPRPKPPEQRRRRNKPAPRVEVTAAPGVPELPLSPAGTPWPECVREWYATWAASDYAPLFDATDWQQLHRMAPVVASYWATFDPALLVQIERSEDQMRRRTDGRVARSSSPSVGGPVDESDDVIDMSRFRRSG